MATPDNGVAAILYSASRVTAKVGNGETVTLKEDTHYPFDENISITVATQKSTRFPLYVRIPAWCSNAVIKVNGVAVNNVQQAASYARIENTWKNGDKVEITLPMKVQLQTWQQNKNSVSVNYGPLTFSLLIKERLKKQDSRSAAVADAKWQPNADASKWPSYEIFPASNWNYGLDEKDVNNSNLQAAFVVTHKAWPKNDFPFTIDDVPLSIQTTGKQIPAWGIDKYGLCDVLPQSPVATTTSDEQITLVPMGAARLRISAFPVVR